MSDDIQAVKRAVERVETAVQVAAQSIDRSIRESSSASMLQKLFWGVVFGWAVVFLPVKAWHSKWRYALQYSVGVDRVNVQTEPHDCEFWAAPLGNKYCRYERTISTLRWATSTDGHPIASYDEGKTWSTFTPDDGVKVPKYSKVENVDVAWEKKEDN